MNKTKVTLLSITKDIPELMTNVWSIAKGNTPLSMIEPLPYNEITSILRTDLPVQEYVNMVWCIEGLPRAFWDQLDRCRQAAFWEQSIRILDLTEFYDNQQYWTPDTLAGSDEAACTYHDCMCQIQTAYRELVRAGVPTEDARGIIPLHVVVRGTFCINLRVLKRMLASRTCFIAQGQYWFPVITGMIKALEQVLPRDVVSSLLQLPCQGRNYCPVEANVLPRITREDPNLPCPVYVGRFIHDLVVKVRVKNLPGYTEASEVYFSMLKNLQGGEDNGGSQEN